MNKRYDHKLTEDKIYQEWEKSGLFTPKIDPNKKPYTILLPLPNANDPMHMGHALFTVQDILIRYHRMKGIPTLWLPGGDHAGIETQFVFEKKLAEKGKSRFDYDRNTLYQMIEEYVEKNKNINRDQMKKLGFSLDWTRYRYSLEPEILNTVNDTFIKLHQDGLLYRDERLANYCTKCGTSFSDLEIKYVEQHDPLYYLKYGPFVLATVRPETKFGDSAVAVHPDDKRYEKWVGKEIEVEGLIGKFKLKVIEDKDIDPKFGTGVAKITPAHDFADFEIGKRHQLESKQIIGFDGKLTKLTGPYQGMSVKAARKQVVSDLQSKGLIDRIDKKYKHNVATCYKCLSVLEPLPLPQWFIKMKPLADPAIKAVKKNQTTIEPLDRFKKMYFDWLENIMDWNISRQIVWGPRLPAWYSAKQNPDIEVSFISKQRKHQKGKLGDLLKTHSLSEIKNGLQSLRAPIGAKYKISPTTPGEDYIQETDTFDTWFLSGQWPLTTLGFPDSKDFEYFYPTSVLDTLWDILFFWVARMMMLCIYRTGEVPFRAVHIHSRVVDKMGKKMSKSKGNVMDPLKMVEKYGADALRFALIFGAGPGSDIAISDDKVRGMRNFANKLWNISRFIISKLPERYEDLPSYSETLEGLVKKDKEIINKLHKLIKTVNQNIQSYNLSQAAQDIYHFIWHELADKYLESTKSRLIEKDQTALIVLRYLVINCLKLLHPFMPFVTEEVWSRVPKKSTDLLMTSKWPK